MEILRFRVYYIVISLLTLISCESDQAPDCFKKSGELETIIIDDFTDFDQLVIYDDIALEIIEAEEEYFELKFVSNFLANIVIEQENDSISFRHVNSCAWNRSFSPPLLRWYTNKSSINIIGQSIGTITCRDTLKSDLTLRMEDATNKINLLVQNTTTNLSSNTASIFNIEGATTSLGVASYFNDCIFNCKNLKTETAQILHRGYNDIIVNASKSVTGSIENAGRILYLGNPTVDVEVRNGGELIHLDN